MATTKNTTTALAQDLQPGDVLVSAALGGTVWNVKLTRVSVSPRDVLAVAGGHALRLGLHEVCEVRRRVDTLPGSAA